VDLDPTTIVSSAILTIPSAIAAYYAVRGKNKSKDAASVGKEAVGIARDNSEKLHSLTNGLMDQKIESAITKVLDERSNKRAITITELVTRILNEQLDERETG
jgi:hypothetical protein